MFRYSGKYPCLGKLGVKNTFWSLWNCLRLNCPYWIIDCCSFSLLRVSNHWKCNTKCDCLICFVNYISTRTLLSLDSSFNQVSFNKHHKHVFDFLNQQLSRKRVSLQRVLVWLYFFITLSHAQVLLASEIKLPWAIIRLSGDAVPSTNKVDCFTV